MTPKEKETKNYLKGLYNAMHGENWIDNMMPYINDLFALYNIK